MNRNPLCDLDNGRIFDFVVNVTCMVMFMDWDIIWNAFNLFEEMSQRSQVSKKLLEIANSCFLHQHVVVHKHLLRNKQTNDPPQVIEESPNHLPSVMVLPEVYELFDTAWYYEFFIAEFYYGFHITCVKNAIYCGLGFGIYDTSTPIGLVDGLRDICFVSSVVALMIMLIGVDGVTSHVFTPCDQVRRVSKLDDVTLIWVLSLRSHCELVDKGDFVFMLLAMPYLSYTAAVPIFGTSDVYATRLWDLILFSLALLLVIPSWHFLFAAYLHCDRDCWIACLILAKATTYRIVGNLPKLPAANSIDVAVGLYMMPILVVWNPWGDEVVVMADFDHQECITMVQRDSCVFLWWNATRGNTALEDTAVCVHVREFPPFAGNFAISVLH